MVEVEGEAGEGGESAAEVHSLGQDVAAEDPKVSGRLHRAVAFDSAAVQPERPGKYPHPAGELNNKVKDIYVKLEIR